MSSSLSDATAILLPASSVVVFSRETATLEAASALSQDWRFARVEVAAETGDVDSAIQAYAQKGSPDLVLVQTDTIDSGFTARLEQLAAQCDEGTSAIVIGPDNDVNLYRKLIDMGVSDYLVRPIVAEQLAEVIAKTLIEKIGVSASRLIAFIGSKGGVGASVLSAATACGISEILGQKTMLLDTAGGWSTFSVGLGFEPTTTLAQVARAAESNDEDSFKRMVFKVSDKLNVLATGGDAMLSPGITPAQIEILLDRLMGVYPVVLVDISQTAEPLQRTVLARANHIMVVAAPTLPSLRLARSLLGEIKDLRGGTASQIDLIINMQGQAGAQEVSKNDIQAALDFKPAAYIPYDPKMFLANENESRKLTDDKAARAMIEKLLLPLVASSLKVEGKDDKETSARAGFLDGLLGRLNKK